MAAKPKAPPEDPSCPRCAHYVEVDPAYGECRRFPPTEDRPGKVLRGFPIVNYFTPACAEWKKK